MLTKIDSCKIEHQSNTKIFVWDYYNIIGSKPKQIMKTNFKSTKYWKIKLKKKKQKWFNQKKKTGRWNLEKKKEKKGSTMWINLESSQVDSLSSLV